MKGLVGCMRAGHSLVANRPIYHTQRPRPSSNVTQAAATAVGAAAVAVAARPNSPQH